MKKPFSSVSEALSYSFCNAWNNGESQKRVAKVRVIGFNDIRKVLELWNIILYTKITFEDWIDIFAETLEEFAKRFSDDGKLSVADGISIFMVLLRAISRSAKNSQ